MPGMTRVCYKCKESFLKEEMIQYSPSGKKPQWYCKACQKEASDFAHFNERICKIFGIKTAGPKISAQRRRIKKTYGYTDDVILDTLEYAFDVKHFKKDYESLGLINPRMVEEMKEHKRRQEYKENMNINQISQQKYEVFKVPRHSIKEKELDVAYDIMGHLEDDDF